MADASGSIDVAGLAPGSAVAAMLDEDPVLVVRTAAGEVRAFTAVCPHTGCTVGSDVRDGMVVCPCHGSRFTAETGDYVSGPAGTSLKAVPITVSGDSATLG